MNESKQSRIDQLQVVTDNGRRLDFEVSADLWTTLDCFDGVKAYRLFVGDFEVIVNRFISALETTEHKQLAHEIDGKSVFEICRMEAGLFLISGKYAGEALHIFISQNEGYHMVMDCLELSVKTRMEWLRSLVELSLRLKPLKDQRRKQRRRKRWLAKLLKLLHLK